jgi:UDPglucose 6-dehydrogenase
MHLLQEVEARNLVQKQLLFHRLMEHFDSKLEGRRIAVWGLAFKPGTDDMRQAPSIDLIASLLAAGATVAAYDPNALPVAEKVFADVTGRERLSLSAKQYQVADRADALVLVAEWKRFRSPDFVRLKEAMRSHFILDGRNQYDPNFLTELGFKYKGVGRSAK